MSPPERMWLPRRWRCTASHQQGSASGSEQRQHLAPAQNAPNLSIVVVHASLPFLILGLSLTALLPAAAWYFCLYCVSFFAPAGAKNDTQGDESDRQAKVLNNRAYEVRDSGRRSLPNIPFRPRVIWPEWFWLIRRSAAAAQRRLVLHRGEAIGNSLAACPRAISRAEPAGRAGSDPHAQGSSASRQN